MYTPGIHYLKFGFEGGLHFFEKLFFEKMTWSFKKEHSERVKMLRGIHASCLLLVAAFLLTTNLADAKVEELSPKDFKNTVLDR